MPNDKLSQNNQIPSGDIFELPIMLKNYVDASPSFKPAPCQRTIFFDIGSINGK